MFCKFHSYAETHLREELKNVFRKKLFEYFGIWELVYLAKIFSSDMFTVVQLQCFNELSIF